MITFSFCAESTIDESSRLSIVKFGERLHKYSKWENPRRSSLPELKDSEIKFLPITFVPDCLVEAAQKRLLNKLPYVDEKKGAIMFADVSGFTALTEEYTFSGEYGIEELTEVLNEYIGPIIACIISTGGDVIKFAGDAFLSMWSVGSYDEIAKVAKVVKDCALYIQLTYGEKATAFKVNLQIKLGVSVGDFSLLYLGNLEDYCHIAIVGKAVDDARRAQELCGPGETILSPKTVAFLQKYGYTANENYSDSGDGYKFVSPNAEVAPSYDQLLQSPMIAGRSKLFHECDTKIIPMINNFVMPHLRDVDHPRQLIYLSEVRQVKIMFLNMPDIATDNWTRIVEAFGVVCPIVKEMKGAFNKVILFDKGCTFLCLFGVPGVKLYNEAASSLHCARIIAEKLKAKSIKCTIAVTTGSTYCGVFGHPHRQEYTVIGRKVNLAARLMTSYTDVTICCDEDTYNLVHKELGPKRFRKLEPRNLKGIKFMRNVFEYKCDTAGDEVDAIQEFRHPPLGISDERQIILSMLNKAKCEHPHISSTDHFVTVRGITGSGISTLLYWVIKTGKEMKFRISSCRLKISTYDKPYCVALHLIQTLLELGKVESRSAKENALNILFDKPADKKLRSLLYLYNGYLNLQFPIVHSTLGDYNKQFETLLTGTFRKIAAMGPLLVVIDEAQNIDRGSWEVILAAAKETCGVFILGLPILTDSRFRPAFLGQILELNICQLELSPLDTSLTSILACQMLEVAGIHSKIGRFLNKHGKDHPGWLKELLQLMQRKNYIQIAVYVATPERSLKFSTEFKFPLMKYFDQNAYRDMWIHYTEADDYADSTKSRIICELSPYVCDIVPGTDLDTIEVPDSIQGIILQHLNEVERTHDQVLLKKAAVLGTILEETILTNICPELTRSEFSSALQTLLDMQVISCYSAEKFQSENTQLTPSMVKFSMDAQFFEMDPQIQETVYKNLTRHQLERTHSEIVIFLKQYGFICPSCKRYGENIGISEGTSEAPTPSFAIDLHLCTCQQLKFCVYKTIADNVLAVGHRGEAIANILNAAEAAVEIGDHARTLQLISKIHNIKKKMKTVKGNLITSEVEGDIFLDSKWVDSKSERITAQAELLRGEYKITLQCIKNALKLLGRKFPDDYKGSYVKYLEEATARFSVSGVIDEANCLGVACKTLLEMQDYGRAIQIAKIFIRLMESANICFPELLDAYSLCIECYHSSRTSWKKLKEEEEKARKLCQEKLKQSYLDCYEIRSIGNFYYVYLMLLLHDGHINQAVDIGFKAIKILRGANDTTLILKIYPLLAQALFHSKRYAKCLEVLVNFQNRAELRKDSTATALCRGSLAYLILHGNFHVSDNYLQDCQTFVMDLREDTNVSPFDDVEYYLAANVALWCSYFGLADESTQRRWFEHAMRLQKNSSQTYWYVAATTSLLEIYFDKFRHMYAEHFQVLKAEKKKLERELEMLEKAAYTSGQAFLTKVEDMKIQLGEIWNYLLSFKLN